MSQPSKVSNSSTVKAIPDQVSSDLAGEAVILNLNSGVYFGLNEVGARIWNLLQEQTTANDIQSVLLEEYEVEPEQLHSDTLALVQKLASVGLVEVRDEATA